EHYLQEHRLYDSSYLKLKNGTHVGQRSTGSATRPSPDPFRENSSAGTPPTRNPPLSPEGKKKRR
ncbi:hypothetical protein TNIN_444521, partial [Trichonephila inaurata madagascariensis]